jgi:hypothetical protein
VDVRDSDVRYLLELLLEELRALREEAARNNRVLEEILEKLGSIDRSQYG